MVMNAPAEAARAPVGDTYTMTGMGAFRRSRTMERMERSRPPGVSSWMTRAWAPSLRARSIAVWTRRTVIGLITPSTWSVETRAAPAAGAGTVPTAPAAATAKMSGPAIWRRARLEGTHLAVRPGITDRAMPRPIEPPAA